LPANIASLRGQIVSKANTLPLADIDASHPKSQLLGLAPRIAGAFVEGLVTCASDDVDAGIVPSGGTILAGVFMFAGRSEPEGASRPSSSLSGGRAIVPSSGIVPSTTAGGHEKNAVPEAYVSIPRVNVDVKYHISVKHHK
jgi:hypothetical protein